MFTKERRLKSAADFNRLKCSHKTYQTVFFKIIVEPNRPDSSSRFGFIVSGKVANAARRNRIKRRLREAARRLSPKIRISHDILIIGRLNALDADFKELIFEMERGLARLGLINAKD